MRNMLYYFSITILIIFYYITYLQLEEHVDHVCEVVSIKKNIKKRLEDLFDTLKVPLNNTTYAPCEKGRGIKSISIAYFMQKWVQIAHKDAYVLDGKTSLTVEIHIRQ